MEIIKVDKFIKLGWIAATFSGALTSILAILAFLSDTGTDPFGITTPWSLFDGIIYLGLAYGIFKKSRNSAIIMFLLHCVNQFYFSQNFGFMAVFLAVLYLQAILGTFKYHHNLKASNYEQTAL